MNTAKIKSNFNFNEFKNSSITSGLIPINYFSFFIKRDLNKVKNLINFLLYYKLSKYYFNSDLGIFNFSSYVKANRDSIFFF